MAPKEPTRHQLSSRLSYTQNTPKFLQKFQNRVTGVADQEEEEEDDEFEYDGSGRPPIPKRPPIPERPTDDPGSADEDRDDEAPQIVVVKQGKHMTEREVKNEQRMGESWHMVHRFYPSYTYGIRLATGLPPLIDEDQTRPSSSQAEKVESKFSAVPKDDQKSKHGLSFASKTGLKSSTGKRKAIVDLQDVGEAGKTAGKSSKKKTKKESKTLLSFANDA